MEFSLKFLIVDDSALGRKMIRHFVEQLGHVAVEAADGASALERYVVEKPHFVVLDLLMPGMSGYDALTLLRSIDPTARVIVCTADVQSTTRDLIKQSGASAIINKPVTLEQISSTLNSVLSGQPISVSADFTVLT